MKMLFKLSTWLIVTIAITFFAECQNTRKESPHTEIILSVSIDKEAPKGYINTIVDILKNRIDATEYSADMKPIGDSLIKVDLYGDFDMERVRKILTATANVEFWETYTLSELVQNIIEADKTFKILVSNKIVNSVDSIENENKKHLGNYIKFSVDLSGKVLDYGVIGLVSKKDSAMLREYLDLPGIKMKFPSGLIWMYGIPRTDEEKKADIFPLYAIKTYGRSKARLDNGLITTAKKNYNSYSKRPEIDFGFNATGSKIWADMTEQNIGKFISISLDNIIYSAPRVNDKIEGGWSSISGNFTEEEAEDLVAILRAGKLPAFIAIISVRIISKE